MRKSITTPPSFPIFIINQKQIKIEKSYFKLGTNKGTQKVVYVIKTKSSKLILRKTFS